MWYDYFYVSLVATNKDSHCNDNSNNNKADNDSHKASFGSYSGSKFCKVMSLKEVYLWSTMYIMNKSILKIHMVRITVFKNINGDLVHFILNIEIENKIIFL